jgi:hypothetical protein
MGRQSKMKQQRRQALSQQVSSIEQTRQIWLDKLVQFDLQRGYGVQYGRVVEITDNGDVFVECLPGYDRPVAALAFTLGYLHVLTLVEEV